MTYLTSILPIILPFLLAVSNVQAGPLCGVTGTGKVDALSTFNGVNTYAACLNKCKSDKKCVSLAFNKDGCLTFKKDVATSYKASSAKDAYTFYDPGCPTPAPTSTVVSTSTIISTATTGPVVVATIPASCNIPKTYIVSSFSFFNSSNNVDCVNPNSATLCFNDTPSGRVVCDPTKGSCTSCGVNVCSTGLNVTPLGYGPPDEVKITVDNYGSCTQTNPAGFRRSEVGNGNVPCGTAANILNFYGNSNAPSPVGKIDFHPPALTCDGKQVSLTYTASFPMSCTFDSGKNATCTAAMPITLNLASMS